MVKTIFLWVQKYERHLSAFAMVAGFAADNLVFTRIDLLQTQVVFIAYATVCFITIPLLYWIETRVTRLSTPVGKLHTLRTLLPFATQFALGGFWSGFVIFYGRSAVFGVSWPFLLFLFLVFLGNEYFYKYHDRLVFTSGLFFFALYSYAIFAVPMYTGTIGVLTFLGSGILAIGSFALFTTILRIVSRDRFLADLQRIRISAFIVLVCINVFYFTNILPPLPLSAESVGIYHSVSRTSGGVYVAKSEGSQSWEVRYLGFAPTLHVTSGELLYAYSSIFAPTALATTITHRWQWYDPVLGAWMTKADTTYPIVGGRDGGYRGYSVAPVALAGDWRVDIETIDGRIIARLPFTVALVSRAQTTEPVTLK